MQPLSFSNKSDPSCKVTELLNELYDKSLNEVDFNMDGDMGVGTFKRKRLSNDIYIGESEITLNSSAKITEKSKKNRNVLGFCLGTGFEWEWGNNQKLSMETNEGGIYNEAMMSGTSNYFAHKSYKGFTVDFSPKRYEHILKELHIKASAKDLRYTITPQIKLMIEQMKYCEYEGMIKDMYLQGKATELLAVCFNEVLTQYESPFQKLHISREDYVAIKLAKKILEEHFESPPTTEMLAKAVGINAFKLKQGFKNYYDKSIYQYVIKRRMENAMMLLSTSGLNIREVASRVGYVNQSHFSKVFKKMYGVNPKEIVQYSIKNNDYHAKVY